MPNRKINHFDTHFVAKEINGYFMKETTVDGKLYKKCTLVLATAESRLDVCDMVMSILIP